MVIAFGRVQKLVVRADVGEEAVCKWREQDPHADMIPLYSPDTIERLTRERDEAVARERERCAKICEAIADEIENARPNKYLDIVALDCAEAIRTTKATT